MVKISFPSIMPRFLLAIASREKCNMGHYGMLLEGKCRRPVIGVRIAPAVFVSVLFLCFGAPSFASEFGDGLEQIERDAKESQSIPEKSAVGKVLKKDSRFLPVPIPISNPTIGTGLAIAGIYLHSRKEGNPEGPVTTSGVAGLYTDSDSWAVAGFHDGFYRNDRVRFRALAGYGEFNVDFYGIGNDSPLRDNPIGLTSQGFVLKPRLLYRLPAGNWFLGFEYSYLGLNNVFDASSLLPGLPTIENQTQTAGLGLVGVYDTRDNNIWPMKGTWFEGTATAYGEYAGGDFNYRKMILKFAQYFPLLDPITFVYRLDGQFIDGFAPFYDLSRIRLRGYSGLEFLDKKALTAQAEIRWNFYRRWTVLGFGGGGRVAKSISDFGSTPTNYAAGGGIRYMIDERRKLNLGVDIAYAEGTEVSVYIQVGDWLAN